jgi:acetylornithine deacetylase/succinyl-diaminopimelate desuccinylase-like protein
MASDLTGATVELLQQLIRNQCVNDGRAESGHEERSVDVLQGVLEGSGADIETYEPTPGRKSLTARLEGSDPGAPTICLMGHTDVVPVTPSGWSRDPFGGELVDGEVWGRGAIDMLNLTSSMAVAFDQLARSRVRLPNTLVYLAVADEEAGGTHGAEWLLANRPEAVGADFVITESGGIVMPHPDGTPRITVTVAEKGIAWRRLRVHGTPGHASMPYGSDNALVTAAEVVKRLAAYSPSPVLTEIYRQYIEALDLDPALAAQLTDDDTIAEGLAAVDPRVAKYAHACTHTTFSPDVATGGVKTNVIPDTVEIEVDVRTLPGETSADAEAHLRRALGDLASRVDIEEIKSAPSTASPTDTPLFRALEKLVQQPYPGARLLPRMTVGGTDARFYREAGAVAYGFGLFSPGVTYADFASRFHGHDERVDVGTLGLTTQLFLDLGRAGVAG